MTTLAGAPAVDTYEAAAAGQGVVVGVNADGACTEVRLGAAAMQWSAEELASRIVRLNTLASLRRQADIGVRARGAFVPSPAQIAAYERTIDF